MVYINILFFNLKKKQNKIAEFWVWEFAEFLSSIPCSPDIPLTLPFSRQRSPPLSLATSCAPSSCHFNSLARRLLDRFWAPSWILLSATVRPRRHSSRPASQSFPASPPLPQRLPSPPPELSPITILINFAKFICQKIMLVF